MLLFCGFVCQGSETVKKNNKNTKISSLQRLTDEDMFQVDVLNLIVGEFELYAG